MVGTFVFFLLFLWSFFWFYFIVVYAILRSFYPSCNEFHGFNSYQVYVLFITPIVIITSSILAVIPTYVFIVLLYFCICTVFVAFVLFIIFVPMHLTQAVDFRIYLSLLKAQRPINLYNKLKKWTNLYVLVEWSFYVGLCDFLSKNDPRRIHYVRSNMVEGCWLVYRLLRLKLPHDFVLDCRSFITLQFDVYKLSDMFCLKENHAFQFSVSLYEVVLTLLSIPVMF